MQRSAALLISALLILALLGSFANTRGSVGYSLAARSATGGSGSSADLDTALRAGAAKAPLNGHLYLAKGLEVSSAGDGARAEDLIRYSVHLNPRLARAHLWLALHYLGQGQTEAGVAKIAALIRLERTVGPELVALLAELSRDPAKREVISARLASQPLLLEVMREGLSADLGPAALEDLLQHSDLTEIPKGLETAQSVIAGELLKREQPRRAHVAWHRLAGTRPNDWIHDGSFAGEGGGPPFAWTLTTNANVQTLREQVAGKWALRGQTDESLPSKVVEQLLVLPPGSYRIRFSTFDETGDAEPSDFYWSLKCRTGPLIAELPIESSGNGWVVQTFGFNVPAGCPTQSLSLEKRSTIDAATRTVTVSEVDISTS